MHKSAHSVQINHSDVPIRLFQSDRLEFFTHISPITVVIIWLPVIVFFSGAGDYFSPDQRLTADDPSGCVVGDSLSGHSLNTPCIASFSTMSRERPHKRRSSSCSMVSTMRSHSSKLVW